MIPCSNEDKKFEKKEQKKTRSRGQTDAALSNSSIGRSSVRRKPFLDAPLSGPRKPSQLASVRYNGPVVLPSLKKESSKPLSIPTTSPQTPLSWTISPSSYSKSLPISFSEQFISPPLTTTTTTTDSSNKKESNDANCKLYKQIIEGNLNWALKM